REARGCAAARLAAPSRRPRARRAPGPWASAAGHRRQQDDGRSAVYGRVETVERPDVLAPDVHVRELELPLEGREARHQVVEEVAHGLAVREHLTLAACVLAQGRRDADDA